MSVWKFEMKATRCRFITLIALCLQGSCLPVSQPSLWCQLASEPLFMPALRERATAPVSSATASRPLPPPPLPPLLPRTDQLPRRKPPSPTKSCSFSPKDARQAAKDCMFFLYPLMVTSHSFFSTHPFPNPCKIDLLNSTSMRKWIKHDCVILAACMKHVQYAFIWCRLWGLTFWVTLLWRAHQKKSAKKTRSCKITERTREMGFQGENALMKIYLLFNMKIQIVLLYHSFIFPCESD